MSFQFHALDIHFEEVLREAFDACEDFSLGRRLEPVLSARLKTSEPIRVHLESCTFN